MIPRIFSIQITFLLLSLTVFSGSCEKKEKNDDLTGPLLLWAVLQNNSQQKDSGYLITIPAGVAK